MSGRRRILLIATLAVGVLLVAGWVMIHSPKVQRAVWNRLTGAIQERTGLTISAGDIGFRMWPARLSAGEIRIANHGSTLAMADSVTASWSWISLLGTPTRLHRVEISGAKVDVAAMRQSAGREGATPTAPGDLFHAFEIERLEIERGGADAGTPFAVAGLHGVRVTASLLAGTLDADAAVDLVTLERFGRRADFGPAALTVRGDADGVSIDRFEVSDGLIEVSADGMLLWQGESTVEFELMADVAALADFWDPNIQSEFQPQGRLCLVGSARRSAGGEIAYLASRPEPTAESRVGCDDGGRPGILGYGVDRLRLEGQGATVRVDAGSGDWGDLGVTVDEEGVISFDADLTDAPVGPLAGIALGPAVPDGVVKGIIGTGRLEARVSLPLSLETLAGAVDVRLRSPLGSVELQGRGASASWTLIHARASIPGAELSARGDLFADGSINGTVELDVGEPEGVATEIARWWPDVRLTDVSGGPIHATAGITGSMARPQADFEAAWSAPIIGGARLLALAARGQGGFDRLDWRLDLQATSRSRMWAEGRSDPRLTTVVGTWGAESFDLAEVLSLLQEARFADISGDVRGGGSYRWDGGAWEVDGEVESDALEAEGLAFVGARCRFTAGPERLEILELRADAAGAAIEAAAVLPYAVSEPGLAVNASAAGIVLERLPWPLPGLPSGEVDVRIDILGSLARPEGSALFEWRGQSPLVERVRIGASMSDGRVVMLAEPIDTTAGAIRFEAELPIGDLTRPDWLWPDSAGGPLRLEASGLDVSSSAVLTALGITVPPVDVSGSFDLDLSLTIGDPMKRFGELRLSDLVIRHQGGELRATGPVLIDLAGDQIKVAPTTFSGPDNRVSVAGSYDFVNDSIDLAVDGEISPEISRLVPFPIEIFGPIRVSTNVSGPIATPSGSIEVDHTGGVIVVRDPALEIADVHLTADVQKGSIDIRDGSALVNRGKVEIGGGWDTRYGQGIVAELDNITLFVEGILSRWSGLVAIEPDVERLARISGDLVLNAGLWDSPFDVTATLFGPATAEPEGDDALYDILLDLEVRGRGGIRVDNNLGKFNVDWDLLEIGGSLADPEIVGDVRIAPGGIINLPGRTVALQRGLVRFTGDESIDPILELVPVESITVFGSGEEGSYDPTMVATRGIASSIGNALGFENETLQPVEIAVETEAETSTMFTVGRRITPNLAFFYATDFADVQNRTTMLQLWNLPGARGLAVQGYQKTIDDNAGANVFQRWRWGGGDQLEDRPEIHRIRLDGSWPLSKRRLRSSTGIRRGQPYDPFLVFIARIRMERELAGEGYQRARVKGRVEGEETAPTLVFTCEPGPRRSVEFQGDVPPGYVRREVVREYHEPPLESIAFNNMTRVLRRHFRSEHYPSPEITVERQDDRIVVSVAKGPRLVYGGLVLEGVPTEASPRLQRVLDTPTELAAAVANPDRVDRIVARQLHTIGFHDARVVRVWTEPRSSDSAVVHLQVEPGPRQQVDEVRVTGGDPLGAVQNSTSAIQAGMPLDRTVLDAEAGRIRRLYQRNGYQNARVRAVPHTLEDGRWEVEIQIEPGVQRTVSGVAFSGLEHINQRVLRNHLELEVGELVQPLKVDTDAVRIANFAPVERVDVKTRPTGSAGSEVEFAITEKARWTAEVGAGWSSERGFEGALGLRDDNLFGRGVGLNLRSRWNDTERIFLLYSALPAVPGGRISFASTIGYRDGDVRGDPGFLKEERRSASIEMMYELDSKQLIKPFYRFARTRTFERDPDPFFPFDVTLTVATLGAQFINDHLDNLFDPRSGYGFATSLEWSGSEIGSDLDTVRMVVQGTFVLQPRTDWSWVQSARVGTAEPLKGSSLDREFRFYAGGQGSIRGFARDSVGPQFAGIAFGGGSLFILNEELRLPLWGPVRAAVFADIGQVWEDWQTANLDLAVGAGVGVRWSTPLGLVWADVAWPVAEAGDNTGPKFYLGIGRPF